MQTRQLGSNGPHVGAIGFGAMGLSGVYGAANDDHGLATLRAALDVGTTLIDTADIYGAGHNERLVGRAIKDRRDDIILATKFGGGDGADGTGRGLARPAQVRPLLEASLKRLEVDHVDLYYLHRVDRDTPIEDTIGAMADLVGRGVVRYIGLSEAGPDTIRRAHKVHAITALQSEYSLVSREPEAEILPTIRALGIGFIAYSPLGRGMLGGGFRQRTDLPADDWRASVPRFQGSNLGQVLDLAADLAQIAASIGATAAQLGLAWLLHQGPDVVPIPGTRRVENLRANAAAAELILDETTLSRLDELFGVGIVPGDRYPPGAIDRVNL